MYILEAHPDNKDTGLFLAGSDHETETLNSVLLAGTLGAMAAGDAGVDVSPLLYDVIQADSRGQTMRNIPHTLINAVGVVLGEQWTDYLQNRLDTLVDETVAGRLTSGQLLAESNILHGLLNQQPPQWLTHEGLFATFSDGGIVLDVADVTNNAEDLSDYERSVAREVGANAFAYQVAVNGNGPGSKAQPRILSRNHVTFGTMTPEGFNPIVTTLNRLVYRQNYPIEGS